MSPAEAFDMGRYAGYVWGSYGVLAIALVAEVVLVRRRRRTILKQLGRIIRITKREQANET
jgi:heme exporter protein D